MNSKESELVTHSQKLNGKLWCVINVDSVIALLRVLFSFLVPVAK